MYTWPPSKNPTWMEKENMKINNTIALKNKTGSMSLENENI